uniref:Uncharacterized protein n=1 Tax=Arundo donax TaxID=35708 RepID=A0A0A9G1E6_ARUDO
MLLQYSCQSRRAQISVTDLPRSDGSVFSDSLPAVHAPAFSTPAIENAPEFTCHVLLEGKLLDALHRSLRPTTLPPPAVARQLPLPTAGPQIVLAAPLHRS